MQINGRRYFAGSDSLRLRCWIYFFSFMGPFANNISRKEKKKQPWWLGPIVMFINLSGWIIVPVLGGLLVGQWLDNKFNTGPWLFLVCIGAAFLVSVGGIIRNTIREYNKIIKNTDKKNGAGSNHNRTECSY